MRSQPRNMPEQEHSIKVRSHELFVEETTELPRTTKPFATYLRETPARPLSVGLRALFWVLGIIVGVLFLIAIWRVSHHHGRKPSPRPTAESTVMIGEIGRGPGPRSGGT